MNLLLVALGMQKHNIVVCDSKAALSIKTVSPIWQRPRRPTR